MSLSTWILAIGSIGRSCVLFRSTFNLKGRTLVSNPMSRSGLDRLITRYSILSRKDVWLSVLDWKAI